MIKIRILNVHFLWELLKVFYVQAVVLKKATTFALNLGAGYKLNSGLNFGLRYSMGLTDVPDFDTDGFKHSVLQLSVGYNF